MTIKLSILIDIDQVIIKRNPLAYLINDIAKRVSKDTGISKKDFLKEIKRERLARIASKDYVRAYDYQDIIEKIYLKYGLKEKPPQLAIMLKNYLVEKYLHVYPDAIDTIKRLKKLPVALIAFSSGYSIYQVPLLRKLNLLEYFDKIATPDLLGYGKPDKRAYEKALKNIPSKALAVGDSYFFDVYGAKNAGLPVVLVVRENVLNLEEFLRKKYLNEKCSLKVDFPFYKPDYVIFNMTKLLDIVKTLLSV